MQMEMKVSYLAFSSLPLVCVGIHIHVLLERFEVTLNNESHLEVEHYSGGWTINSETNYGFVAWCENDNTERGERTEKECHQQLQYSGAESVDNLCRTSLNYQLIVSFLRE